VCDDCCCGSHWQVVSRVSLEVVSPNMSGLTRLWSVGIFWGGKRDLLLRFALVVAVLEVLCWHFGIILQQHQKQYQQKLIHFLHFLCILILIIPLRLGWRCRTFGSTGWDSINVDIDIDDALALGGIKEGLILRFLYDLCQQILSLGHGLSRCFK
jgi:hypothetical protein